MVAPKENLLSLGHQVNMERHAFKTQRVETQKQKRVHLLQHCQEMQEGVRRAQQHNRQLLQQFKEAQGTLREMLTLTAAMKTTRMEYEKHLVGNPLVGIPQWRQQLQENTWEKRNLNNTTERSSCSPGQPLPVQLSYDGSFHSAHIQSSWMVPPRNPHHPQDSTHLPPHLPSNPPQLYHQASGLSLHQSLPWQNVPDQPWFWTAAAARSTAGPEARFCVTEPPAESRQHSQMSSPPSSDDESAGSRNCPSGPELDTQPDGGDCTTESSQVSRKKRGKAKHTFSEGERHSSPDFQSVSVVLTEVEGAQSSWSLASSESRSTTRSAGADGGLQKLQNGVKERNKKKNSQLSSEECEQRGREESGWQRQSSGRGDDLNMKNECPRSRCEGENEQGKEERLQEEDPEEGDEDVESDENMDNAEKQDRKEDISKWKNTTDEEENAEAEEEMEAQESEEEESDGVKDKDNRKLDSTRRTRSSEEDVDAESEFLSEEEEESDENNKPRDSSYDEEEDEIEEVAKKKGDEAAQGEDESDSDDCIISLQKSKRLHVIPEEARGDEDAEAQPGNTEEDSDESSDNVKDPKTQAKEMKHEQKPKGGDRRGLVTRGDSDEFDHFFD